MKEVAILKNAREEKVKGQGSDDFQEDILGGLNATIRYHHSGSSA